MNYTLALAVLFLIPGCKEETKSKEVTAKQTAETYCGSCHLFPEPALLDKTSWKENVLPPMAKLLGIDYLFELPLEDSSQKNSISVDEWKKIMAYYLSQAPDTMPDQGRGTMQEFTNLFTSTKLDVPAGSFPSTSFVKIDSANRWVYAGNAFDSSLTIYDDQLKFVSHESINGVLVDISFTTSLEQRGKRMGFLTKIGTMNPNDLKDGSLDTFSLNEGGKMTYNSEILGHLPRPVHTTYHDLDHDGTRDYLICGFGNREGALFWTKKTVDHNMESHVLRPLPGAIKAYVEDFNNDGLPDIMVLMAQADEGIYLLRNKGNGMFATQTLVQFPPVYGSSYFELDDFNGDGYQDILYTCGDNADYTSRVLKNYHGVYIFLNDRHNNFTRKFFFPVHGCFKAMAADFDLDGDLDIAAISYFPDTNHQPQESFVFLEQGKDLHFKPYTIREYNSGRWLTMDVGDVDGDGDKDIVLGSLVPPVTHQQQKWKESNAQKAFLLLLKNQKLR